MENGHDETKNDGHDRRKMEEPDIEEVFQKKLGRSSGTSGNSERIV
jgi:hypothetical protein